jgi:hypothetical protein
VTSWTLLFFMFSMCVLFGLLGYSIGERISGPDTRSDAAHGQALIELLHISAHTGDGVLIVPFSEAEELAVNFEKCFGDKR